MNIYKKTINTLGFALLLSVSAQAQSQNFKISPEHPKELDTIKIVYDARQTILKDAKSINARLTGFKDFKWVHDNLQFVKDDSVWSAKYVVPEKMGLMNFVFNADTLVDKGGDQTYSYILSRKNGGQVSGGMLGWGLLRTPHLLPGVPFVVDESSYKTNEILMMWVKYELQYHPQNRFKVLFTAANVLKNQNTKESLEKLNNELNALQQFGDITEEDWTQILRVYKEVLKDQVKAKAIEDTIKSKFPNGKLVSNAKRLQDFKLFQDAKDNDSRLKFAKDFIDNHPYAQENAEFDEANRINYTSVYWIISVFTSVNKDFEAYKKYVSKAPTEAFGQIIYRSLDVPYSAQKTVSAIDILPYAQVVMERIEELKQDPSIEKYYYSNAPLFAKILQENKLYAQAFIYVSAAQSELNFSRADVNDTYVRILDGQGKKEEVKSILEKSYKLNQSSTYMLDFMKAIYISEKKSDKGYDSYLASLKDSKVEEALKAKIRKHLINKDFTAFELKDQNGNLVKLNDQKGKIVVLDYWASWCAPCKAAFPGMQLAVDHFNKDPNVVFYFILTQERKADMSEYVKDYMKENGFNFVVLMDENSAVSKLAGVSAIPHKMVLDGKGKLRFSEVGYMGSASELKDEIIEMVTLLKAEK